MTEASKEAVEALAEAGAIMFAPNNIWKAAELTAFGLEKRGYTIAPTAPMTDEKLREACYVEGVIDSDTNDLLHVIIKPCKWDVIKSALSELAQRRAIIQEFVDICDKAPPIQLMQKIAELRGKLPTPPKDD